MQLLHKYFNPVAELVILIGIPTKEAKKKKKKKKERNGNRSSNCRN